MKRLLLFSLLVLFIFSCSSDDKPNPTDDSPINSVDNDPIGQGDESSSNDPVSVVLNLDGVTELDLSSLKVVSLNSSISLNSGGNIDLSQDENQQNQPFLFTKNDELLFGYYRNTERDEISNIDILFYYFSSFPAITIRGISDDLISEILSQSQYLDDIEREMAESLNLEQFPFENEEFSEQFVLIAQEIFAASDISGKSKEVVGEFKFDYSRGGMISWPIDVPLFAALGVEIIDNNSGNVVKTTLKPKSLDVVGGLYDLISGNTDEYFYDYQLTENGSYEIRFSNGNPNFYDNFVTSDNRKLLATKALNFAMLGLLKAYKNLDSKCAESVTKVLDETVTSIIEQRLFASISIGEYDLAISKFKELVVSIVYNLADIVGNCVNEKFISTIAFAAIKVLTLALDVSEIYFNIRDFIFSNIYGTETRYFEDGVSVGTLNETKNPSTNLSGKTGDVRFYTANYIENQQKYLVDRGPIESKFVLNEEFVSAKDLPFNYEFVGDVKIEPQGPIKTFDDGDLELIFTLGEENSEVVISPDFYYPVDLTKSINVSITNCESATNYDEDGDGIFDDCDNCKYTQNSNQNDSDEDGIGDGCPYPLLDEYLILSGGYLFKVNTIAGTYEVLIGSMGDISTAGTIYTTRTNFNDYDCANRSWHALTTSSGSAEIYTNRNQIFTVKGQEIEFFAESSIYGKVGNITVEIEPDYFNSYFENAPPAECLSSRIILNFSNVYYGSFNTRAK